MIKNKFYFNIKNQLKFINKYDKKRISPRSMTNIIKINLLLTKQRSNKTIVVKISCKKEKLDHYLEIEIIEGK